MKPPPPRNRMVCDVGQTLSPALSALPTCCPDCGSEFRAGCPAFLVASALELKAGIHGISLFSDPMAEIVFSPAKPVDGGVPVF